MKIEFEATPDRVRFTAAYRRLLHNPFRPYRGTGIALGALAVVALLPEPRIVAAVLAGAAVLFFFFSPALMLHRVVATAWPGRSGPARWTFGDEGVRWAGEDGESLVRWPAVTRIEQVRDQLLVTLKTSGAVVIPLDTLSAEQRTELISFLQGRGLLPDDPALGHRDT
ncbi:YcxB family protein [Micromonospora sp. NPDC007271]|uniref:YcxB family protein n=1 Tax=Micromonospora sp. NPDC007271 TaxID=3154587 RepID=UPI0033DC7B1C